MSVGQGRAEDAPRATEGVTVGPRATLPQRVVVFTNSGAEPRFVLTFATLKPLLDRSYPLFVRANVCFLAREAIVPP